MTKNIISILTKIISEKSPKYLVRKPYEVYQELVKEGADKGLVSALLYAFANDIPTKISETNSNEEVTEIIMKNCSLNKKMASKLATIFIALYDEDNKKEWHKLDNKGFTDFKNSTLSFSWEGFATWQSGHVHMPCHYNADIKIKPTKKLVVDEELQKMLKTNPFLQKEEIERHYLTKISQKLDDDFDDYCTCEEYYEPCVEDFEVNIMLKNGVKIMALN